MELGLLSSAPVYAPAANLTLDEDTSTMLSAPPAAAAARQKVHVQPSDVARS
jgi:hypothetical protein